MADLERLLVRDWELVRLKTDQITLDVAPALGGTIVSLRRRSDDSEILWRTPWGLRPRGASSIPGSSEAEMLDTYPGGWQTVFPNGGDTSIVYGVEWGHDGEARVAPFEWEQAGTSVIMTSRLVRSPFQLTKTISVLGAAITVSETVQNVGGEAVEVMWGQQVVLGQPLIGPDSVVEAAATTVHPDPTISDDVDYDDIFPWPRSYGVDSMINLRTLPGPGSNETRLAYLADFSEPKMSVRNPRLDLGIDLDWEGEVWPYVWYSMEAGRRAGFPWFSDGYFLSLTPSTSWPAHGIHDARRVAATTLWIQPDEIRTAQLSVRVHAATTQ
ncbi:MAG: hypothetical protein H0T91_12065 [Propionibacteriaceae bacterium]|nr:hypothetical protein [Propionibacteriaceae bacterium]